MITVNIHEAESGMAKLLGVVESRDEVVLICRDGKPVAELRAAKSVPGQLDPLQMHPELAATILYDPTEVASEDEWPGELG